VAEEGPSKRPIGENRRVLLERPARRPPDLAAERARELTATGAAGLFTFEGQHDVFRPLAMAAGSVETDLMTNVAISLPRSPLHLAHAAHDLQLLSKGRFRLGLGSQVGPHIEHRYGGTWSRPAARMRETVLAVKAISARGRRAPAWTSAASSPGTR
jgi:alkanesulfonate monooxygenase SsuD/methylene tetrahydromethanopterin reductase-like flavin-dependent oxidoreductase (luciferase family)